MNLDPLLNAQPTASLMMAREFVQLELLRRLSASDLRTLLAFKGGTALHLLYRTERFSEDLDFSLTQPHDDKVVAKQLDKLLEGETIMTRIIKRRTVLFEMRQPFASTSFRVKVEINVNEIAPAELRPLSIPAIPVTFTIPLMRPDWLCAQKVRAFLQRTKPRDLYDLWFILQTKLPLDMTLVAKLTQISPADIPHLVEKKIDTITERSVITDLNPFLPPERRTWSRRQLKSDTLTLFKAFLLAT